MSLKSIKLHTIPIAILFYGLPAIYGSITHIQIDSHTESECCNNFNKMQINWLTIPHNTNGECINVIQNGTDDPITPPLSGLNCLFEHLRDINYTVIVRNFDYIEQRNISAMNKSDCENFIIFTSNQTIIRQIFADTARRRFFPYTHIFMLSNRNPMIDKNGLSYIYGNALHVHYVASKFFLDYSTVAKFDVTHSHYCYTEIRNILTERLLKLDNVTAIMMANNRSGTKTLEKYFGSNFQHPFISETNKRIPFRVSLFNCPPYVLYLKKPSMNRSTRFDGLEVRFVREIFKNWKIQYLNVDNTNGDVWYETVRTIERNESDLALCSVWMTVSHNVELDMTFYYDYQCGTFLVPKPTTVNNAYRIYRAMDRTLWLLSNIMSFTTTFFLYKLSKLGQKLLHGAWKDAHYATFVRAELDVIELSTFHGISRFPKHDSIRILVVSWSILSFFTNSCYLTGYTSQLTMPHYTKPIDTLRDFVDHGLLWGYNGYSTLIPNLKMSGEEHLHILANRAVNETSKRDRLRHLRSNKYGVFTKIVSNRHATDLNDIYKELNDFRVMKECVVKRYTAMALSKNSPYTLWFNFNIQRYQQYGIIDHWSKSIDYDNKKKFLKNLFIRSSKKRKREPKRLMLKHVAGVFWMLGVGHTISLIAFHFEYWSIFKKIKLYLQTKK